MRTAGSVEGLWVSPSSGKAMQAHQEVQAVADCGFADCAHARPGGGRQILLVEKEVLDQLGLAPGRVKENITTTGLDLRGLARGTRLKLGREVVLEIARVCHPCRKLETVRRGLSEQLRGRRGVLATVIVGGTLHIGDAICVLEPALAEAA